MATPFGPYRTTKLKEVSGRKIMGILTIALGIFLIIKNFIWSYILTFLGDPFFWALISMFALIGSSVTLVSRQLGRFPLFNMALVAIFTFGRFILPLPFFQQPRFDLGSWQIVIGGIIFIVGLVFLFPLLEITPWPTSDEKIILKTTGFYNIVRNPIYLGEILWSLGWAIMLGSIVGVALVPLWWGGLLFHVILEEEDLERKLGKSYLKYKQHVHGRIVPGLPI